MSFPISLKNASLVVVVPVLDFGGVESRILVQAKQMRDVLGELRMCCFWKAGAAAEHVREAGVRVDVLDVNPSIRNPAATVRLARYLRQTRPHVLHSRIGEANWHGLIAGAAARVPVRIAEEVGIPVRSALGRRAYPWVYRLAHRVIGVSRATCDYLERHDGVAPRKTRLVYNSADVAYFRDPPLDDRPRGARFRVLTVGRLEPVKNQAFLIRCFAELHARFPATELKIVGEGTLRPELEGVIRSQAVEDCVHLVGFREDVRSQLARADLFVLPSRSEGFGITLVEAMACGVPVLASDVGGVREVIGELGEEFLLPPTDGSAWVAAMARLMATGRGERERLGRRAREIACRRFSPEAYAARLEAVYAEAVTERWGRGR